MAKQVTWRWNGKAIPEEGRFDVDDDMPIAEIKDLAFEKVWDRASLTVEVIDRQTVPSKAVLRRGTPCDEN